MINANSEPHPIAYSIRGAVAASGMSRTRLFAEIRSGRLRSVQVGRRRMVTHADLVSYFAACADKRRAA